MQGSADYLVVGAGGAGCVIARRLAERPGASVLLLEAGGEPDLDADGWRLGTQPDWGFEAQPDGDAPPRKLRRGRVLGGTSWFTRFAVRGPAADFDAWAARGNPGWSFAEVLPAFRALERDADFADRPWHGGGGPFPIARFASEPRTRAHAAALEAMLAAGFEPVEDHNAPDAVGVGPMPMSVQDGRRVTTWHAYLAPAGRPPGLEIRPTHQVDAVVLEGTRAVGVRLVDGSAIRAGTVILAAGTYGTPPILLRSGIGPAADLRGLGLEVAVDLPGVGANLADHPGVDLDTGYRGDGTAGPLFHSIATWRSSLAASAGPPDLMFWVTDPDAADAGLYLDPVLLKPSSRGSVRLRSSDPLDRPRIQLPGVTAEADRERLAEAYERGLEIANHPSVRAVCADPTPAGPAGGDGLRARVLENAYSLPHVVGTCRMGPSPRDGDVVDHLGRVHGIDGLHVVDASIIPDAPSGFPHVITIMAAEHLAARI